MSKFIEVQEITELVRDGVDSVGNMWDEPCDIDAKFNGMYGVYYEGLQGDEQYLTDAATAADEKITVLENLGQCFKESHDFDLYTANGKKYILLAKYEQVWPAEN